MGQIGRILEEQLENIRWEYNIIDEVLCREDLTSELLDAYSSTCNTNVLEFLMLGDQIERGEYTISQKLAFAWKMKISSKQDSNTTGIYNSYVEATGKFDINQPFQILCFALCIIMSFVILLSIKQFFFVKMKREGAVI